MKTGRGQTEPNAADGQQTRHAKPNQWGRRVPMIVGEGSHAGQGSVGGGGGLGSHGCDGLWAGPAEERQLGECGEGGGGEGTGGPPSSDRPVGAAALHPLRKGLPTTPPHGAADAPPRSALPRAAGRNRPLRPRRAARPRVGGVSNLPASQMRSAGHAPLLASSGLPCRLGGHGPDKTTLAGGRTGCVRKAQKVQEGCGLRGGVGCAGPTRDPPARPPHPCPHNGQWWMPTW